MNNYSFWIISTPMHHFNLIIFVDFDLVISFLKFYSALIQTFAFCMLCYVPHEILTRLFFYYNTCYIRNSIVAIAMTQKYVIVNEYDISMIEDPKRVTIWIGYTTWNLWSILLLILFLIYTYRYFQIRLKFSFLNISFSFHSFNWLNFPNISTSNRSNKVWNSFDDDTFCYFPHVVFFFFMVSHYSGLLL